MWDLHVYRKHLLFAHSWNGKLTQLKESILQKLFYFIKKILVDYSYISSYKFFVYFKLLSEEDILLNESFLFYCPKALWILIAAYSHWVNFDFTVYIT